MTGRRAANVARSALLAVVLAFLPAALAGCDFGGGNGEIEAPALDPPGPGIDPPVAEPIAGSPAATAGAGAGEPATVADIFPATGLRGLVLNNCASCHAVACLAIGRRTPEQWRQIEANHVGAIPGLSIEDRGRIFDYLRRNFNDTLPEPRIPAEFLADGCPSSR